MKMKKRLGVLVLATLMMFGCVASASATEDYFSNDVIDNIVFKQKTDFASLYLTRDVNFCPAIIVAKLFPLRDGIHWDFEETWTINIPINHNRYGCVKDCDLNILKSYLCITREDILEAAADDKRDLDRVTELLDKVLTGPDGAAMSVYVIDLTHCVVNTYHTNGTCIYNQ